MTPVHRIGLNSGIAWTYLRTRRARESQLPLAEVSWMFAEKTVFVLGAGANLEHGFVTGTVLKEKIRDSLRGEADGPWNVSGSDFFKELEYHTRSRHPVGFTTNELLRLSTDITTGLGGTASIDEFLHAHRTNERINRLGKFAIVNCILELESRSRICVDPERLTRHALDLPEGAYSYLWEAMRRGMTVDGLSTLGDEKFWPVTIITFNYDRSLEQFLFCRLVAVYKQPAHVAARLVGAMKIIHVYGSVGPWICPHGAIGEPGGIPYGLKVSSQDKLNIFEPYMTEGVPLICELANSISTYTQQIESGVAATIKTAVQNAKQVYFLGVGYHAQNMKLLMPEDGLFANIIAGTAVGMTPFRCGEIERNLLQRTSVAVRNKGEVIKADRTCEELFKDYGGVMQGDSF